ncbi:hypothetical protein [Aeoliella sp. SH292]|uniref:hypothetical protein n=1 Tax=Aeoliella sp. SH292 TaxID=3454464 RepID=UPI003F9B5293
MSVVSLVFAAKVAAAARGGKARYELWRLDHEIPEESGCDESRKFRPIQEMESNGVYVQNPQYAIAAIDFSLFLATARELDGKLVGQFDSPEECLAYAKDLHCELTSSGWDVQLFDTVDL